MALEGAVVLDDLDLSATAGHNVGTMREFTVVSDGSIDLEFRHVRENPLVNARRDRQDRAPARPASSPVQVRSYDGQSTVGAPDPVTDPNGTVWAGARNAFWVGGTVFYGPTARCGGARSTAPRSARRNWWTRTTTRTGTT